MAAVDRGIRVTFQERWAPPKTKGLLDSDPKVRTLLKVLVSYPEVRHILPDKVSLNPDSEERVLDTVAKFLGRQAWLVRSVQVL